MKAIVYKAASDYVGKCRVGCCLAISLVSNDTLKLNSQIYRNEFEAIFKPRPDKDGYTPAYWFGKVNAANKLPRQLALLFMAEIIKDEKRSKRRSKQR